MIRCTLLALLVSLSVLVSPAQAALGISDDEPIGGTEVRFTSPDGVELVGNVFRPSKGSVKGSILFVHEPFRTSRDWEYLAEKMSRKGFVSLIFDLRGHGRSMMKEGEELDRELFGDEDYQAMTGDVRAALEKLRSQKGADENVHLAGADLGGSLALLLANEDEGVRSVALLSPGLGYDGVNVIGQVARLNKKPLMLVFSTEDGYARKSTEVMEKEAVGPIHTETYYGVGHGTKMLAREPKLEVLMTSWFLGTVITAEGRKLEDAGKPITEDKDVASDGREAAAAAEKKRLEGLKKAAESSEAHGVGDDSDTGPKKFPQEKRRGK